MCGIVGTLSFDGGRPVDAGTLRRMTHAVAHRGPDDSGVEILGSGRVGLGFRRLSIIDLSMNGHQPMRDAAETAWIIFNGEVYNFQELRDVLRAKGYQFRSSTDTEVVLNAYREWGVDCLSHFNGMFAFAIWDARSNRLFVARDRFGIKPLYYTTDSRGFSFASEIKSLLVTGDVSMALNPQAVWSYLTLLQIPAPESIYASIRKLPPAHAMVIEASGRVAQWQYWRPDLTERELPEGEIVERIRTLFEAAVRRHLVADVPVGVFLSGGIDSSAIVAYASRLRGEPVNTFSVSFPGDDQHDEAPFQRLVVDRYRPHHHEFRVIPNILDASRLLLQESDEPFAVSSAIPLYHISKNASQHVKVVLSGDGGDELFAGYESRYRVAGQIDGLRWIPQTARHVLAMTAAFVPNSLARFRGPRRLKKTLELARYSDDERYLYSFGVFGAAEKVALLNPEFLPSGECGLGEGYACAFRDAPRDRRLRYFYVDLVTALSDEMLAKVDRCTSMVSIEGRVPFLDREFSDFALSIPLRHKFRDGVGKWILRRALEPVLPNDILWGKKRGFNVPMDAWTRSNITSIRTALCRDPAPEFAQVFRSPEVARVLAMHERPGARLGHHVWALLQFNEWCRMHAER